MQNRSRGNSNICFVRRIILKDSEYEYRFAVAFRYHDRHPLCGPVLERAKERRRRGMVVTRRFTKG